MDNTAYDTAQRVFARRPELGVVWSTADGQVFTREGGAIGHAKELKDKTVTAIKRGAKAPAAEQPTEDTPAKAPAKAAKTNNK